MASADDLPKFALCSRQVITPAGVSHAAVIVRGGTIQAVVPPGDIPQDCPTEDLEHLVIAPGVVDANVHVNEPGRADWEGFQTATAAAAAGGITTLVDMPLHSSPATTSVAALAEKRAAATGQCYVDVGFYGGLAPAQTQHIAPLIEAGVMGIKTYLCPSGSTELPLSTVHEFHTAMPLLAEAGVPLLVHSELPSGRFPVTSDRRSYAQYQESRPMAWELDAIALVIGLCRRYHCPVHILHLSSAEGVDMVEWAVDEGLPLTVETCPHYLHFAAEQIAAGDTRFKCVPPIRGEQNREQLWRALQRGLIDTISSNHSPCPPAMKQLETGEFTTAWGGIAALQFTLPAVWTGAAARGIKLGNLAIWLSQRPAKVVGLEASKGQIAAGFVADLAIWDPNASFPVTTDIIRHRHRLTPYEGESLQGVVRRTYVRGQLVYQDGQLVGSPQGKLLERPPAGAGLPRNAAS